MAVATVGVDVVVVVVVVGGVVAVVGVAVVGVLDSVMGALVGMIDPVGTRDSVSVTTVVGWEVRMTVGRSVSKLTPSEPVGDNDGNERDGAGIGNEVGVAVAVGTSSIWSISGGGCDTVSTSVPVSVVRPLDPLSARPFAPVSSKPSSGCCSSSGIRVQEHGCVTYPILLQVEGSI